MISVKNAILAFRRKNQYTASQDTLPPYPLLTAFITAKCILC